MTQQPTHIQKMRTQPNILWTSSDAEGPTAKELVARWMHFVRLCIAVHEIQPTTANRLHIGKRSRTNSQSTGTERVRVRLLYIHIESVREIDRPI